MTAVCVKTDRSCGKKLKALHCSCEFKRKRDRSFGQINGCPEASCGSGCLWISILFVLYLAAGASAGSVKAYSGTLQTNFARKGSEFQT